MRFEAQENSPGCLRLLCLGEIRSPQEHGDGSDPLVRAAGEGYTSKKALLDLSGATYISSNGIGWLLGLNHKFNADGGLLVLHSVPPMVKQIFTLMKLGDVLKLADNLSDAEQRILQAT